VATLPGLYDGWGDVEEPDAEEDEKDVKISYDYNYE
jgi:hypothetical protein